MLAQMVARGELPPVDQRLPEQPKVVEPVESVGRYGGEFNVYALDNMPWNDLVEGTVVGASWVLEMTADGEIASRRVRWSRKIGQDDKVYSRP